LIKRPTPEPVEVAQANAAGAQRFARTTDDASRWRIEPHNVERRAGSNAEPAALADGEMDDSIMAAEHAAVEIDDFARCGGARTQPFDDVGIAAARHKADILAVLLIGDREPEAARQFTRLELGAVTEREPP